MSNTFNETCLTVITNALSLLGVVGSGETVQTNDYTFCLSELNAMVKAWQAQGIHLWSMTEGTVYLTYGQGSYNLAQGTSYAYASDGSGTPVETTLTANAGSGATSITVTTSTGMSIGDNIGIKIQTSPNPSLFWTTISNISGTTITLTAGLSAAANSGDGVFTYTTQLSRPLEIESARLRDNNGFDRVMRVMPRDQYMSIPQKTITGNPIVLAYNPQLTAGIMYVWPCPQDVNYRIEITYLRSLNDLVNSSDNLDFPQEWLECITYNLAVRLAPAYGINLSSGGIQGNPDILRQAATYLDQLLSWDTEQPYIQLIRNYDYRR